MLKQSTCDVYRWEYGERECQLHEVCDDYATQIVLRREASWPKVEQEPAAVEISVETEAEVARSILRWLGR